MNIVLCAAAGYFILSSAVRLLGRRTASMIAPFDLVLLPLFGGITSGAVVGEDHSMAGVLSSVFTIGLMQVLVSGAKAHFQLVSRIIDDTPIVVFELGHWQDKRMLALRMTEQDVMAAARQRGIERLEQILYAVSERGGKIAIIEKKGE